MDAAALAAFAFVPGLAIGSFLNVVVARLPLGRSLVHPASACPSCDAPIARRDNIPVLSYLLLRGRCRNCRATIAWHYPVVELVTALLVVACFVAFGLTLEAVVAAFFCAALVAVSAIDIERFIIPNRIVLPAAAVVLVAQTAARAVARSGCSPGSAPPPSSSSPRSSIPAGMGMGDVKLALLLGVRCSAAPSRSRS